VKVKPTQKSPGQPTARPRTEWRRPLLQGGAAAGLALAAARGGTAHAAQPDWRTDAGVFLAYHFGGGGPGQLGLGVEARLLYMQTNFCGEATSARFAGALARIELVGWDQVRLVVGPELGRNTALSQVSADLSVGLRLRRDPGLLVEPGFGAAFLNSANARLAYAITRDFSAGAGARLPLRAGEACRVTGRPLRRGQGRAPLPVATLVDGGGERPTRASGRQTRALYAWAERASTEWASAPAFAELAQQLEACGAPEALRLRALVAGEDELRHAVMAGAVAAGLGGQPVSLEPPSRDRRPAIPGVAGLVRLAVESWLDGCLGEAAAACCAAIEAESAQSPEVRRSQRAIADDESRHAELAWDVLTWTLSVGGPEVRAALSGALANPDPVDEGDADDLADYGCLPLQARRHVAALVRAQAIARLQLMLARA
jgi:hypothetical protein